MPKTIFALVAAGILGVAMVPTAADAMSTTSKAAMRDDQTTLTQEQAKLKRDQALLRRDVRLGKTVEAARLRKQINADQRAISRAKHGMEQGSAARNMQPTEPKQPTAQQNQTNTQTTSPDQNK